MLASLQFKDYHVKSIEYKFDPFFESDEDVLVPKFDYKIIANPENNKQAWVTLLFSIGDKELNSSSIYVNLSIGGFFEVHGIEDEESILNYYKVNAIAILFPYLRSVVSDITSKGSEAPLILPTLNIVKMIEDLEKEKNGSHI